MRVLLVEDSVTARRVAEAVLRNEGWQVSTAGDAVTALRLIRELAFDLVLMDRELPDASGDDVVRALRVSSGPNRFSLVVALSGTVTVEAIEQCRCAGMLALLEKPLKPSALRGLRRLVQAGRPLTAAGG
ncbi:MAG: response regulator [Myxococcaceae bacterium]